MKLIFISIFFFCSQIKSFPLNEKGAQVISEKLPISILNEKELKFSKVSVILLNETILIHNYPSYPYSPKAFLFDPKTFKIIRISERFDPFYQAKLPSSKTVNPQKRTLNPTLSASLPIFSEFSPEHPSNLFKLAKNPSNSDFELFVLKIDAGETNQINHGTEHQKNSGKIIIQASNNSSNQTKYNSFIQLIDDHIAITQGKNSTLLNENSKYEKNNFFKINNKEKERFYDSNFDKEANYEKKENFYFWEKLQEKGEHPIYREEAYLSIFQKKGRIGLALSGGVLDVKNFNEIWIWESEMGWIRFELGFSVWGHAMVQIGENEFVLFGGIINGEYSNKAYLIRLDYLEKKVLDSELKIIGDIPIARAGHKGFSRENSIFFVSGCNYELKRCFDDIIKIEIKNNLAFCNILSSSPSLSWDARENFAGLIFSNTYFIFGGCNVHSQCKESPTFLRFSPNIINLPQQKSKACNFRGNANLKSNNSACICLPSYYGYFCENEFCPDSCSSHGDCDRENLECQCENTYFGENCASKKNCGDHGIAVEYNDNDNDSISENLTRNDNFSNISSSNKNEKNYYYQILLEQNLENPKININYYCQCTEGWEGERCDRRRGVEGCWDFGGGYKGCFAREKKDSDVFDFKGAIRWGAKKIRFRFDAFLEKGIAMAEALVKNERISKQYDVNLMMESFIMKASMYEYFEKTYVLSGIMLISIERKGPLYLQGIFHNGTAFALKGLRMGKSERVKDCFANGILMDDGSCKCFKNFSGKYCHFQEGLESYIDYEPTEKRNISKKEEQGKEKININSTEIDLNEGLLLNEADEVDEQVNFTISNNSEKIERANKSILNEENNQVIPDDAATLNFSKDSDILNDVTISNFSKDSDEKLIKKAWNNENIKNESISQSNLTENYSSVSPLSSQTLNYTKNLSIIAKIISNISTSKNSSFNGNATIEQNDSISHLNENSDFSTSNKSISNEIEIHNNSEIDAECKGNCFGKGECKNSICFCYEGYTGIFCQLKIEKPCQGAFLWGICYEEPVKHQEAIALEKENLKKRFRMKRKEDKFLIKKAKKAAPIVSTSNETDFDQQQFLENLQKENNNAAPPSVQSNFLLFLWAFGIIVIFISQNIRKK